MLERVRENLYAAPFHADRPYDEKESVRLERACALIRCHKRSLNNGGRYELLDIGCGVGPLRQWLPADEFRITGLEFSQAGTEAARKNYDACELADIEGSQWPVPGDFFDGLHAGAVLEHVLDWHTPLNHANQVLKTGGLLVISVPNLRYWKEIRRLIRGRQPHWLQDMGHVHAFTPRFLNKLVQIHGFHVVSLEADRVNLPLLPERWATKHLAAIGSVLILAARLSRRARVENVSVAQRYPNSKYVGLRSIEIMQ